MTELRLRIYRRPTEVYQDREENLRLHAFRAGLLHGLVDILPLEVKDWGETDDSEPHEVVEIAVQMLQAGQQMAPHLANMMSAVGASPIIDLATSAVFTGAVVALVQTCLHQDNVTDVEVFNDQAKQTKSFKAKSIPAKDLHAMTEKTLVD